MHIFYCLNILFILNVFSIQSYAQPEKLTDVVENIDEGIKYLSEKEYAKSIEKLVSSREKALRNNWHSQAFNATLNIGTNYYLMMDYGEAFHYYLEAYEIAVKHLGPKQEMQVFNNVGVLYTEDKDEEKAIESFLKAYEIAKKLGLKEEIGAYAINLALVGNKAGALDFSERYIEEAMPLLKESSNIYLLGQIAKVENLFLRGEYSNSEQIARTILPKITDLSHSEDRITVNDRISVLTILAKIYRKLTLTNKAQEYGLLAREAQKDIEARADIYEFLSSLNRDMGKFDIAMAYKDSVVIATDSLYAVRDGMKFKSEKLKFQVRNYQNELIKSKETLSDERKYFYVLIFCIVLLMGFLTWFFKNNLLKQKQSKRIVELELENKKNEADLANREHQEREALIQLERERLKHQLELKNRELTVKALHLSSKNELIEEIILSMSKYDQIDNNSGIGKHINELRMHLKKDSQWDNFFIHFEEINQGFLDRLRTLHPNLTPGDIRVITFLYMNLSYKEIASILNITPQSCRKRKERISKKLNLSGEVSLHSYLSSI